MKSRQLTLDELIARLQDVEQTLKLLDAQVEQAPEEERGRLFAHQAQLQQSKHWYLGRIRAIKPVEALNVEVHEDVSTADTMG